MCLLARIMCSQLLLLLLLLLSLSLCAVEAGQWTVRPRRTTTTPRSVTTTAADRHQHVHHWPPLVAPPFSEPLPASEAPAVPLEIRLIDSYDQRTPDGQSEFRYQLSNGDTRYERTYWLPVGKGRSVLARRGFYSVPLPSAQYSTVYYRADHRGYHVDTHTLSEEQPVLPRSLDVAPLDTMAGKSTAAAGGAKAAAKRNSIGVPERNDSYEQRKESPRQSDLREPQPDASPDDDHNDTDDDNDVVHVDDKASRVRIRLRGRYPSEVKVHAELEQPTVNKTFTKPSPSASASTAAKDDGDGDDNEDILASQVGTETEQELPDDDDDVSASSQSSIRLN